MKKIFIYLIVIVSCCSFCSAKNAYELGVIAGEPTGISVKKDLGESTALAAAAGWSFSGDDEFSLHVDHLWFNKNAFKSEQGRLPLYYGIGGRIKTEDESLLGARFPIGVQYFFRDERFTLFAEIAPILDLFPDTELRLNAAIGFRIRL